MLLSESAYRTKVCRLARSQGWKVNYLPDSRWTRYSGFPDVFFEREFDSFFVEFKAKGGLISEDQMRVIRRMRNVGIEVYVWEDGVTPPALIQARLKKVA